VKNGQAYASGVPAPTTRQPGTRRGFGKDLRRIAVPDQRAIFAHRSSPILPPIEGGLITSHGDAHNPEFFHSATALGFAPLEPIGMPTNGVAGAEILLELPFHGRAAAAGQRISRP